MAKRTLDDFFAPADEKNGTPDIPAAKIEKPDLKPKCKYGAKCYRKNPAHFAEFSHDEETTEPNSNESSPEKSGESASNSDAPDVEANSVTSSNMITKFPLKMPSDFDDILADFNAVFGDTWSNSHDNCLPIHNEEIQLTGAFDFEIGTFQQKFKKLDECQILSHGRFRCDPVESQTVVVCNPLNVHLAYWRDTPEDVIGIVAIPHSSAKYADKKSACRNFPKILHVGDNLYAAMIWLLTNLESSGFIDEQSHKLMDKLQDTAKRKNYNLGTNTEKFRQRRKDIVAPTLHTFGICVPFKDDIGYRPLSETNANLRKLLTTIGETKEPKVQQSKLAKVQEMVTYVQFANDECDFGMGLELGHDLIISGYKILGTYIKQLLSVAYMLLQREKFQKVLDGHLKFVLNQDFDENLGDLPFCAFKRETD